MKKIYFIASCGMLSALFVLSAQADELRGQAAQVNSKDMQMLADIQVKMKSNAGPVVVGPDEISAKEVNSVKREVNCFLVEFADDPFCIKHFPDGQLKK